MAAFPAAVLVTREGDFLTDKLSGKDQIDNQISTKGKRLKDTNDGIRKDCHAAFMVVIHGHCTLGPAAEHRLCLLYTSCVCVYL